MLHGWGEAGLNVSGQVYFSAYLPSPALLCLERAVARGGRGWEGVHLIRAKLRSRVTGHSLPCLTRRLDWLGGRVSFGQDYSTSVDFGNGRWDWLRAGCSGLKGGGSGGGCFRRMVVVGGRLSERPDERLGEGEEEKMDTLPHLKSRLPCYTQCFPPLLHIKPK